MTVNTNGEDFGLNIPHLDLGQPDNPSENLPCGFQWSGCFGGKQHSCYRDPTHNGLHVCTVCRKAYVRERINKIVVDYRDP